MKISLRSWYIVIFIHLVVEPCLLAKKNTTAYKHFVIDIASYNNKHWYKRNLDSVFIQDYPYYRVIYTDDNSPDKTGLLVEQYIKNKKQEHRVTLIKNIERKRSLANHYNAITQCKPEEIIVVLDGDDWFADKHVLSFLNEVYQDPNVWMTYGQFINWPTYKKGYCIPTPQRLITRNRYRQHHTWIWGHLRSYHAWLAQLVKKEDLLYPEPPYEGQFFPSSADLALGYPMLEMAGEHAKYIDKILYIRNVATPLNNFKIYKELQIKCGQLIQAKPPYEPLQR